MIIDIENVTVERNGRAILRDVSWRVRRGEHWALVGANGAGKTTLLQVVCGTLWPTRGTVTVLGERYGGVDLRELRRRIGWFSSSLEPKVNPREPVSDLVASGRFATLGLQWDRPTPDDYARADRLLDLFEAEHVAHQAFATLSQGERQKALLCRALVADPPLVVLDEPCTGLDLAARERLLAGIERLARTGDGPTLVLVTHHVEEIVPAIKHTLLLADGRVAASGPNDAVLTGPVLGETLGVPLEVERRGGRFRATVRTADDGRLADAVRRTDNGEANRGA